MTYWNISFSDIYSSCDKSSKPKNRLSLMEGGLRKKIQNYKTYGVKKLKNLKKIKIEDFNVESKSY
jgi:hypothetical protein